MQYTMACAKVLWRQVRPMAGAAERWGGWSLASQERAEELKRELTPSW